MRSNELFGSHFAGDDRRPGLIGQIDASRLHGRRGGNERLDGYEQRVGRRGETDTLYRPVARFGYRRRLPIRDRRRTGHVMHESDLVFILPVTRVSEDAASVLTDFVRLAVQSGIRVVTRQRYTEVKVKVVSRRPVRSPQRVVGEPTWQCNLGWLTMIQSAVGNLAFKIQSFK